MNPAFLATVALFVMLPILPAPSAAASGAQPTENTLMQIEYLEIVTTEPQATIAMLEAAHGVTFGEPVAELGGARTAELGNGGRIAVRGQLRPDETPVVRPYLLVKDIDAAVQAAESAGGQVAIPPMEIPGQGRFAIYILGGIEHGLWQR